jgi:hypothetical protein
MGVAKMAQGSNKANAPAPQRPIDVPAPPPSTYPMCVRVCTCVCLMAVLLVMLCRVCGIALRVQTWCVFVCSHRFFLGTRVLQRCYNDVKGCYKSVTRMLQECYKGVARVFSPHLSCPERH